jgi:non-lysosomal glucosylceramidase
LVGQYVADYCGLGPLVDPAHIRKTLASIYRYNHKRTMYEHAAVQRIFAINDESALVICDYPGKTRPKMPFPYFAEVMTGFEYSAAILMLAHGMVDQGVECIANIRRRYDGERRNPWDEAECGHHYARAMAAWSGLVMLSGFRYEGPKRSISVEPLYRPGGMKSFWSTASAWGVFAHSRGAGGAGTRLAVEVKYGKLTLSSVELGAAGAGHGQARVSLGGSPVHCETVRANARARVLFAEPIQVAEGGELVVVV